MLRKFNLYSYQCYVPYIVVVIVVVEIGRYFLRYLELILLVKHVFHFDTGLHEFTNYLRKEYSHENIRFWLAVNDLKRCCQSQILQRVKEIYE